MKETAHKSRDSHASLAELLYRTCYILKSAYLNYLLEKVPCAVQKDPTVNLPVLIHLMFITPPKA